MGGYGLIRVDFLRDAVSRTDQSVLEQVFAAELEEHCALLDRREVARGNRRGDLELLNFFATPDFDDPLCLDNIDRIFEAFRFFVKGFRLNGIWQENATPQAALVLERAGYSLVRRVEIRPGQAANLLHLSREAALETPGSFLSAVMQSPEPRLGLTPAEQALVECALLDRSDRDICKLLDVGGSGQETLAFGLHQGGRL